MARLRTAGHHVEAPPTGSDDPSIWAYAQEQALVVLTADPPGLEPRARATPSHRGLLVVHGEGDPRKQMRPADIADAVALVREMVGDEPMGHVIYLNAWRRAR